MIGYAVQPGHPLFGKVETCECRKAQIHAKRMDAVLNGETGIPVEFQGLTFATWDALPDLSKRGKIAARKTAEAFAESGVIEREYGKRYWGLVLAGETGRGKSGLAASIMVRRVELGINCLWIDFRQFLRMAYSTMKRDAEYTYEEIVGVADSVQLLVWDDFADVEQRGEISDYVRNVVYDVISRRHREHLPTVIPTNLSVDQIYDQFGDRIGDRIAQMCYWQAVGTTTDVNLRFGA